MRSFILLLSIMSTACYAQKNSTGTIKVKKPAGDSVYSIVQQMPVFNGSGQSLQEFIGQNVKYPLTALDSGRSGTSYIAFIVEKDGSISNFKVIRGADGCPECDTEALRVIKMMKFKPAMQNDTLVRVWYNIPVRFSLR